MARYWGTTGKTEREASVGIQIYIININIGMQVTWC